MLVDAHSFVFVPPCCLWSRPLLFIIFTQAAAHWKRYAGSAIGQATLEGWGMSKSDAAETEEALHEAAALYTEGESDTEI